MWRWTIHLELVPPGSTNPEHRPSRTELRGAVYGFLLGARGHDGWTPWRAGQFTTLPDGIVTFDLWWLADLYGPEREPEASDAVHKLGSWMVRIVEVARHAPLDRWEAVTSPETSREFTVRTFQPVSLTRELPARIDDPHGPTVDVLYPDEQLIVERLAKDWNAAGTPNTHSTLDGPGLGEGYPPSIHPHGASVIGALTGLTAHRDLRVIPVQTRFIASQHRRIFRRCITGSWSMRLFNKDDADMLKWFSILMRWAPYAGIGAGPSYGLGAVTVVAGNVISASRSTAPRTDRASTQG